MSLSEFISAHMEDILTEWERYARTIPTAASMDAAALRDSAEGILRAIVTDMAQLQSTQQQEDKSKGLRKMAGADTASEIHATTRSEEGFNLIELASEYRALRASVIRLWTSAVAQPGEHALYELTRFNEGIDEAWSRSTARFVAELDHSRDLFLAILGHDLRNPLSAVSNSAQYLLMSEGLSSAQVQAAARIARGAVRIEQIVADLIDVTRTRLGKSLPIMPRPTDLNVLCEQVAEEARAHHPDCAIQHRSSGSLRVYWDPLRITQMLSNLVENAVRHGNAAQPVSIAAVAENAHVVLTVHNEGKAIPHAVLHKIFEPLVQVDSDDQDHRCERAEGLGLGLYIARQIVEAHHGTIEVESTDEAGTTFKVRLPAQVK